MYTCRKCKSEIEDFDRYCYYCGSYIGEPVSIKNNWETLNNGKDSSRDELNKLYIYICNKCSSTIKLDDRFCRKCGIELSDVLKKEYVIAKAHEDEVLSDLEKRNYRFNFRDIVSKQLYKIIFIIIFIFICAVIAKYTIFSYKETHGVFDDVYMTSEGKNVYYTNVNVVSQLSSIEPKISTYKIIGNKVEKIFDGFAIFPNVKNNWLYYTDSQGIYKIKINGTEKQKLINGGAIFLRVEGNFIYYMLNNNIANSSELYRMNLDGTFQTKISSDVLSYQVVGNYIYYSSSDELGTVYKMNLDGSHKTKLCTIDGAILYVKDSYIYYRGQDGNTTSRGFDNNTDVSEIKLQKKMNFLYSNGYLCRTKIDGSGKEILLKKNTKIFDIVFYNNFIIYQDSIKNFYKLDLNGKNEELILDQNLDNLQISVINNYMYYYDTKENRLYKKSLNSKEVITFDLISK